MTSSPTEPNLEFPTARRVVRCVWRGVRLRCPQCGGGHLRRTFLHLREYCPTCGLRLARGEDDYYLGGMMFNIFMAEAIFAIGLVGVLWWTWPDVPWAGLEWVLAVGMVAAPILLYPVSQTVWLGFDLAFRPAVRGEFRGQGGNGPGIP